MNTLNNSMQFVLTAISSFQPVLMNHSDSPYLRRWRQDIASLFQVTIRIGIKSFHMALTALNTAKASHCNTFSNFRQNGNCRAWCVSDGKGRCDTAANAYCAIYNDDSICDCINSPLGNPQCNVASQDGVDVSELTSSCRNSGYWTSNMNSIIENGACPTTYNCRQDWDIDGASNIVHDNTMVQICGPGSGDDGGVAMGISGEVDPGVDRGGTIIIPGTDIELPQIPGLPEEDIISGIPNTLLVILILIVIEDIDYYYYRYLK